MVAGWAVFSLAAFAVAFVIMGKMTTKDAFKFAEYRQWVRERSCKSKCGKKYAGVCIFVGIVGCVILGINFSSYIKIGLAEVNTLTSAINAMPPREEIDYSEYESQVEEVYTLYSSFDFWQKMMLKKEDAFVSIMAGFNEYRVDNLKSAMGAITLENVSQEGVLTNAVAMYAALNDEQRALLTQDEINLFDTFSTINEVVSKLFEINGDVIEKYDMLDDVLMKYQAIDDAYKNYVYNYDLVAQLKDRYSYLDQFLFELVDGGYSIKAKEGVTISGTLEIPETYKGKAVTTISENAFSNHASIVSVVVPNSVISIAKGAFAGCSQISTITLPFVGNSRTAVDEKGLFGYIFGEDAYAGGTKIEQYYASTSSCVKNYCIPQNLKTVIITDTNQLSYGAFYNCSMLSKIVLWRGITDVGDNAFRNCKNITSIDLPNITSISTSMFHGCVSLQSVHVGNSVMTIGNYAFKGCENLSQINSDNQGEFIIGAHVRSIGVEAFNSCVKVESITLPFTGKSADASAYEAVFGYIFGYTKCQGSYSGTGNSSFINDKYGSYSNGTWQYSCIVSAYRTSFYYYIPNSLKTVIITQQRDIPVAAFNGCTMLTSITYSKGIGTTGNYAFQNCTATVN